MELYLLLLLCFPLGIFIAGKLSTIRQRISCQLSFNKNRRRLLQWYTELLAESPSMTIVLHRIGAPRTIITANPENVEYILKTNFANFPKGKSFTDLLGDFLGNGIFNVDGEMWRIQRKIASHAFSTRCLKEYFEGLLVEEVRERLIPVLEEAAENGEIIDMQEVLKRFAFDSICKETLGIDPLCLQLSRSPPPPIVAAFDAASAFSAMRGASIGMWKVKRALNLGKERELKEAICIVREYVEEMLKRKKETGENGDSDLLSRFLKSGFSDEGVRDMVISFLMAGRDTTSAAMTWFFWLLTAHREIEKQAVDEVSSVEMGFDDMRKMDFLKACLCETMRLYPPVIWDSKHAANDDVLPDGTVVGKGDRVTYFQYGMGRMEKLWGKNWSEFIPARWLDENGVFQMGSPFKFPCFQAGRRECLGKEVAFIQMIFVVASVLRRFELVPVSSETPVLIPMLTATMGGGFNVRVRRRTSKSSEMN